MLRQEAILQSPLRILDRSIRGGLGKGHLGVILAPAGIGKSACLVQLGLDALLRGRAVLHLAVRQPVDHVCTRYDAHFEELARRVDLKDREGVRDGVVRRRLIWSSMDGDCARALDEALAAFRASAGHDPTTLLVEGFGWDEPGAEEVLRTVKAAAARIGAEAWMTAREALPHERTGPARPAPLSDGCAGLVDVALLLEPHGPQARLTLVKDFDRYPGSDVHLVVEAGALRSPGQDLGPEPALRPEECTLLALGSAGAEAAFGACAERWGVQEVNYTFAGREAPVRTRGQVELTGDELRLGDVSAVYVEAHLHRALAGRPELRPVLQAIWHQVSTAGEVFAVGTVGEDRTAHGGTGWAVELARHWDRPVHLFDLDQRCWLRWDGQDWQAEPPPVITQERFAGAGTRALDEAGREAIRALFERSFGPPTS
ncbi:MAG: hypothetical protein QM767_19540 [Anaeromyxobacter sp.]